MKKLVSVALLLVLLLVCCNAVAEDLGVQIIGGANSAFTPMSLDDIQIASSYTIDGYAIIKPVEFVFTDYFAQFIKDANYRNVGSNKNENSSQVFIGPGSNWFSSSRWWDAGWKDSGVNAEFAWLKMDITNTQKKSYNFTSDVTVKVIYQDDYEFGGWVRQINYDYLNYANRNVSRHQAESTCPNVVVLDPANVENIDMMYTGTYVFGATLPNSVVEDKKSPLKMTITIDGN